MEQQQIRVHYGLGIVTATLLEEVHDGVLKGWNKLRMADGHECYMSANSIVTESNDTDWRSFLKTHWDTTHNYLRPDCAEEFMTIFNRAAAEYYNKKSNKSAPKKVDTLAYEGERMATVPQESMKRKAENIINNVSTTKVSKRKMHHAVQLSLFPDLSRE